MEQDVKTEWMEISPEEFRCDAFQVWGDNWLALAAGDFEEKRFNAMTVGWGFFGTMWAAPAVMVVVRPQRHTYGLIQRAGGIRWSFWMSIRASP